MNILYMDVLLTVNYGMDYLSLYFTGRFLHLPMRQWRLLVAGILGAAFAVIAVLFLENSWGYYPAFLLCGGAMVGIAYGRCSGLRHYAISVAVHLIVSMLLGGAVDAMYQILEKVVSPGKTATVGKAETMMLLAIAAGVLVRFWVSILDRFGKSRKVVAEIFAFGKRRSVVLLCDSGHMLREPISGNIVIVLSPNALGFLPISIRRELSEEGGVPQGALQRKIRVIPATGIGGHVMLRGFVPDEVRLHDGRKIDAVIAMGEERDYGGTDGIIPPV